MNRNMLNHSQVGQGIGMSGRTNSMGSSGLGSPNRSSPSIICMPKQQPARQPFTINRLMHCAEVAYLLISIFYIIVQICICAATLTFTDRKYESQSSVEL